ncbi:lig [Symbiodinium sp. CCMP2456]|nr:lig [Symbiodinium sp. CCMP2456]
MGGAQASLCCCWQRQKTPTEFPFEPPRRPPHTNEPVATTAAASGGEDDEEVEFELGTLNTFLEYRQVSRNKKRSHSMPRSMRPCRDQKVSLVAAGNMEETAGKSERLTTPTLPPTATPPAAACKVGPVPDRPPIDDRFEPFLTPEMVSAERRWKRDVLGRLAWHRVPARPHSCAHTCPECCQLWNNSWRLAAADPVRVPGHADPCRALHIMPRLPERALLLSQ